MDRFGDEFLLNSRAARARIDLGEGAVFAIELNPDQRGIVQFPLRTAPRARVLTLYIDDVIPGTKWNDLAISEIEIDGRAAD